MNEIQVIKALFDQTMAQCRRCGELVIYCTCWWEFMNKLEKIISIKAKKEKYNKKAISINTLIIDFTRRTPSSISGMKGLTLLKRKDKR